MQNERKDRVPATGSASAFSAPTAGFDDGLFALNAMNGFDGLSGLNGLSGIDGMNGLDGLNGPDGLNGFADTSICPTCGSANNGGPEAALDDLPYRTLFHTSLDAVVIKRMRDGYYLEANQAFLAMTGFAREEVIGHSSLELHIWEDPRDRERMIETLERESACRNMEARFRRKNGEAFWGLVSASVVSLRGVDSLVMVLRDTTAQKEAARRVAEATDALRATENRYRTAFHTSVDAIAITRLLDGVYIDVNAAFQKEMGYRSDEVVARSSLDLNVWVDLGDRNQFVAALRRNGFCQNFETCFRRKDGSIFCALLSASTIILDGEVCLLSVVRDITDAKANEAQLKAATEILQASEERYRAVFRIHSEALAISKLPEGIYLDASASFLAILGYSADEVVGRSTLDLNLWADLADRERFLQALHRDTVCAGFETRLRRKDGALIDCLLSSTLIELNGSHCALTALRDITHQKAADERAKQAIEELRSSEERYRAAFHTSLVPISLTRIEDGQYLDVNEAFLEAFGYTRSEVLGSTSLQLGIWADSEDRNKMVETLRSGQPFHNMELRFRKRNQDLMWMLVSVSTVELNGVPCALSVMRDVSQLKAAQEEIRNIAFYDSLTGLPNRRLLMDRLNHAVNTSARGEFKCALLFLDLDRFKNINDTLGHRIGDLLLQEVAHRLAECTRKSDTVARLGGDEFVVLLEDIGKDFHPAASRAKAVGEKILAAIAAPIQLEGHTCRAAASIGISLLGNRKENAEEILQQADIAMYQAKSTGRGTLRFFAPALQAAVAARAHLEESLRQAIESGQFLLHYQPLMDGGRVAGAEALARWQHPERGLLLPAEFIPVAEETGLIVPLGRWILDAACAQIAAWSRQPQSADFSLSVNISAQQLLQPDFVDAVLQALANNGAQPHKLVLEFTEAVLTENVGEAIGKVTRLKAHGVRFALDNFGTIYSSLFFMKRLPFDQLKMDRTFVHDSLLNKESKDMAQAVISLVQSMGFNVVAEGVETDEQKQCMDRLGCHCFQGFLFSPAVAIESFEKICRAA